MPLVTYDGQNLLRGMATLLRFEGRKICRACQATTLNKTNHPTIFKLSSASKYPDKTAFLNTHHAEDTPSYLNFITDMLVS